MDVFRLGAKVAEAFPERSRPILLVGLRTAGSYFAPLLRGYLEAHGYEDVSSITLRPKRDLSTREGEALAKAAGRGALAVIVDEPVWTAKTLAKAVGCLKKTGFQQTDIAAAYPEHPGSREWKNSSDSQALSDLRTLTLQPEEWHKNDLLQPELAGSRIREYLRAQTGRRVEVMASQEADRLTAALTNSLEPGMHWRIKRVFEVRIGNAAGQTETRFVIAKSVGWGWLGYHAFIAGMRLDPFVPRLLGLRDGFIFMEFHPVEPGPHDLPSRQRLLDAAARYVDARARKLVLPDDPTKDLVVSGRHRGTEELAGILSGAYGWKLASVLRRPAIQQKLAGLPAGAPVLVDGKMRPSEWIDSSGRFIKTDFEHHGMGKHELNLTDPAYDLADFILQCGLTEEEERFLIRIYVQHSGDSELSGRLMLYKLLAGNWAMNRAFDNLSRVSVLNRHAEFNQQFLNAWNFLVVHMTRYSAGLCSKRCNLTWSEPLVVLDVDGVLDRQMFGFPSTTAAGIESVSLLASHGMAVALNTARSADDLKEYCRAYGFLGGVAEYGSFIWDATTAQEQVLIGPEATEQLEELRRGLQQIPGVYMDDRCAFSIRAFCYARGTTVPVPEALVRNLIAGLNLTHLSLRQTYTDSTVTCKDVDKGTGLRALLSMAGRNALKTVAIGDSEPDLPMFRAATRSFAPAQIACRQPAMLLGCRIASRPYQAGLLEIVRSLLHPKGETCGLCQAAREPLSQCKDYLVHFLQAADRAPMHLLAVSALDPKALRAFLR